MLLGSLLIYAYRTDYSRYGRNVHPSDPLLTPDPLLPLANLNLTKGKEFSVLT